MWIEYENKVSLCAGEDNFFSCELPEKIAAGFPIIRHSKTNH